MEKNKYPLITVKWADHFFCADPMTIDEVIETVQEPLIGEYAGYLVAESQRMIALSSNKWDRDTDDELSPTMYIMKRAIIFRSDRDDTVDQD